MRTHPPTTGPIRRRRRSRRTLRRDRHIHRPDTRDPGVTLVELILAISLTTVVMTAVASAVVVLITNDESVRARVGEAQDVRQLVNYLPADVRGTEARFVAFDGVDGFDANAPTSCDIDGDDGTLHLALGSSDGARRIEYRSVAGDDGRTLVRWTCADGGSTGRVRIADHLRVDDPVSVRWIEGDEGLVEMTLHHDTIGDTALSASPFLADEPIVEPPPAPPGGGPVTFCPPSPNQFTRGFALITAGDVEFNNQGETYGAIAVGGDLTFKNATVGKHTGGTFFAGSEGQPTAVLVQGMVDWPDSGGGYLDIENGYLHVGNLANWAEATGGPKNQLRLTATEGPQNRQIRVNNTDQTLASVQQAGLLDFAGTFQTFGSIADALVGLPGSCEGITELELLGQNGVGEWTGGNLWLRFEHGMATTVTFTMDEYRSIGNVNIAAGSAQPTSTTPLIITITDAGEVTMPSGETNIPRNHVPFVLWNFPNATKVTTNGVFWGAMLAPRAHVVQNGDIRGNVISASLLSRSGLIDQRPFEGVFPWPAPGL